MVSDGQRDPCHCLATARWSHSPGLLEWPPGFRGCPDQSETANRPAKQTALRPDTLLGPAHGEFLGGRLSAHRAHTKSFAQNGSCRSEERRVGKECRCGRLRDDEEE